MVDIGYIIANSFYFGPANNFTQEQWVREREPVYKPDVPMYGDFALSCDAEGSENELIKYYQNVIELCHKHHKHHKKHKKPKKNPWYFQLRVGA